MIDRNEAIKALKEKLEKMSHDEREQYLKKMGFSFEGDESNESEKYVLVVSKAPYQIVPKERKPQKELGFPLIDYIKPKITVVTSDEFLSSRLNASKSRKQRMRGCKKPMAVSDSTSVSRYLSRRRKMKENLPDSFTSIKKEEVK